jgi:CTP:molybdopterin cytidylyltransferase MocA
MATSYNGWPASRYPSSIGVNARWEPIPGHRFPGGVKSGDVEVVLTYFVRQLHSRVERIELYSPGDEWGYNYKASANSPYTLSCHASATAFDYNATRHPNGRRGTWSWAQLAEIRKIQRDVDGVVHWLGDAPRVPDEMHFEIRATAAQVKAVADKIRAGRIGQEYSVGFQEEVIKILNEIRGGVLTDISEGREDADDTPENMPDMLRELRVNTRTAIQGVNEVRKAQGLPALKIVVGYNSDGSPRYQ